MSSLALAFSAYLRSRRAFVASALAFTVPLICVGGADPAWCRCVLNLRILDSSTRASGCGE
mgnify:CR=1 FL=1